MSLSSSNSDELAEALEATRRNVRQLEMDTHRVRTDLTRLEVVLEASISQTDAGAIPHTENHDAQSQHRYILPDAQEVAAPAPGQATERVIGINDSDWQPDTNLHPFELNAFGADSPFESSIEAVTASDSTADKFEASEISTTTSGATRLRRAYRYVTSPVVASLIFHGAVLLFIASLTVATIVHTQQPFTATVVDLGTKPPEPPEQLENLDLGQIKPLDETNLETGVADASQLAMDGPMVGEVTPIDFESVAGPPSLGDLGAMSAPPTDLGTELQGNGGVGDDGTGAPKGLGTGKQRRGGGGGGGRAGGAPGSALFFGTKSKGDRFVFVIDNSSSMKGGRLEMALAELVKTVESLSSRQSFYVIFVSDQSYPMFYPQLEPDMIPATPPNKKRLIEWLPKAVLASGKNRELIKAMDMAATLRPHAVYLLWDGDMRYSETVRLDVMTHLTAPNQWNFTIHTLGMGLTSLDSEQNLTAIAQAHGGMFRRIEVPSSRKR